MKLLKIFPALLFMILIFGENSFGQTKQIGITVKDIDEVKGQLIAFIYNKEELFPKEGKYYKMLKFPVTGKETVITIKDLPVQDYAIFICHDSDNNGKCNQNWVGIPSEKIAFSNNVKPKMKAPSFKEARIPAEKNNIVINLYYY